MSARTERDQALIIAYLTGQASESEIVQFRSRIGVDTDFRNRVERIETWLAPLDRDIDNVQPPEGLLDTIMAEIGGDDGSTLVAANDAGPVQFWRRAAIAASIVAVLSLGSHFFTGTEGTSEKQNGPYLALLSGDAPSPLVAIIYDPTTDDIVARLSNVTIPEDGDLQLWLIREGETGPVSLGLLERTGESDVVLTIPEHLRAGSDTLALSLEALGGSASGAPEGPVLYTGKISALD